MRTLRCVSKGFEWASVLRVVANTFVLTLILFGSAQAEALKSYKDRLFAYPKVLESRDNGDYRVIDYRELRDINKRDQVPERRVKAKYVDYVGKRATKTAAIDTPSGRLTYYYAGKTQGASMITIYIHGKGGNGKQGINDFSFGGNFNRIKMLMIRNGGLYLSPDAGAFTPKDIGKIETLIERTLQQSPGASIIVSCGSGGGAVCYQLANRKNIVANLGGFILMGSYWNPEYLTSLAGRARVPLFIGHGSRDTIFAIDAMEGFYQRLHKAGIPVRMVRFETGTHGTPIRMTDWRSAINWITSH